MSDDLGDRFMEILRSIYGDMPDAFADSARLAFVHALKEAQPTYVPLSKSDIDETANELYAAGMIERPLRATT